MALLSLVAATEALFVSASHIRRRNARRQQTLMCLGPDAGVPLPFLDEHIRRTAAGASRLEVFAASRLAELCRQVVKLRLFEYLLLQLIRTGLKRRKKLVLANGRFSL
jgi:hypothetical protein